MRRASRQLGRRMSGNYLGHIVQAPLFDNVCRIVALFAGATLRPGYHAQIIQQELGIVWIIHLANHLIDSVLVCTLLFHGNAICTRPLLIVRDLAGIDHSSVVPTTILLLLAFITYDQITRLHHED